MKVSIKNFQAIKDAELVFPVGITTIVGSTNSGKTAIMRGMIASLDNPKSGKYFIHTGEDSASVTISDDENEFEWIRGDKTVSYRVGEENFSKCGKSDIWSLIPGYSIKKESNGSILNFHTENDLLFPFRFTSGELFTIFERIVSLDDTASVTKDIQGDLTGTECSLHRCNDLSLATVSVLEETRSALEEIETIVSTLKTTILKEEEEKEEVSKNVTTGVTDTLETTTSNSNSKEEDVSKSIIDVSSLTTLSTSSHHSNKDSIGLIKDSLLSLLDDLEKKEIIINDLENKLNELRDITRSLDYLVSIENNTSVELTSKFNKTTRLVETLLSNKKALLSCKETCHRLSCYQETPCFNTTMLQNIQDKYNHLLDVETKYNNLSNITNNLSILSNIPCILETEPVKVLFNTLNASYSQLRELRPVEKKLQCLVDIPEKQSISVDDLHQDKLLSIEAGLRDVLALTAKENKINQDIDKAQEILSLYYKEMDSFDACPLCGTILTQEGTHTWDTGCSTPPRQNSGAQIKSEPRF